MNKKSLNSVLKPGQIINGMAEQTISSWPANKGGYFVKLDLESEEVTAITNNNYKGKGFIVFVDIVPIKNQSIILERVMKNCGFGKVINN